MDVSRYSFTCKKSFHDALRLGKSLGHGAIEIEHVAICLLRDRVAPILERDQAKLYELLLVEIRKWPRGFGISKIGFGRRLMGVCATLEKEFKCDIREQMLWQGLLRESSILKNGFAKLEEDRQRQDAFVSWAPPEGSSKESKRSTSTRDELRSEPRVLAKELDQSLTKYTIDLNEIVSRNDFDPIIGRDEEVRRVFEVLGRKKKNNPLLLGDPGVGKSAIAELLAQRIETGKVPEGLKGVRVLSLDLGSMLAGAKYRGEFEDRLKAVVKALSDLKGAVVLFVDEIHMLIGAGNAEGGADAANLLKPALARGDILCVGATTFAEYNKYFKKDQALDRRFQPIVVNELSREATVSLLRTLKSRYEKHHGIEITDDAIVSTVDLAVKYLPNRRLPDKALDVMDEASSRIRMALESMPREVESLKSQLESLQVEKQAMDISANNQKGRIRLEVRIEHLSREFEILENTWQEFRSYLNKLTSLEDQLIELENLDAGVRHRGDYDFAATISYQKIPDIKHAISEVILKIEEIQRQHPYLNRSVDKSVIASVVSEWCGVPIDNLDDHEVQSLASLEERLSRYVFGQQPALGLIAKTIKRSRLGIADDTRPMGVFLFLGTTGVGKTETAKALAVELFGDVSAMIRFDMSEFVEPHTVFRLIGSPPGYVGFDSGGELSEAVRKRPYTIVLLDEVEKAHPKIFDVMLQIFDDGRLTDGKGDHVDFTNAIILMTSNLPVWQRTKVTKRTFDESLRKSLEQHFRPEFVNRIDDVVVFSPLGRVHYEKMIDRELATLNLKLDARYLRIVLDSSVREIIIQSALFSEYGGRALKRTFKEIILDSVTDQLLANPGLKGVWILASDDQESVVWSMEDEPRRYLPAPS